MSRSTNKIYLTRPDLFKIEDAVVVDVSENEEGNAVVKFDKTIFHPQGGGQVADKGTINDFRLITATKEGDPYGDFDVNHILPRQALQLKKGDHVKMQVDPEFRLRLSALHTIGHLISNFAKILFNLTYQKCMLDPDQNIARLVFILTDQIDKMISTPKKDVDKQLVKNELTLQLNAAVNEEMGKGSPLIESRNDRGQRQIAIGGLFPFPCAGTHVHTLSDIRGRAAISGLKTFSEADVNGEGEKVKVKKLSLMFDIVPLDNMPVGEHSKAAAAATVVDDGSGQPKSAAAAAAAASNESEGRAKP